MAHSLFLCSALLVEWVCWLPLFYKRLASQIAIKRDQPYSKVISWLRCHLCFSLLHSSATAIRGAQSFAGRASIDLAAVDLAVWVGRIASH